MADIEAWLQRWQEGRIGFHRDTVQPLLERRADRLPTPGRVFVPFSGKSHDLLWLEAQGWEVVACEVARAAVEAFHLEHGRLFRRTSERGFEVYRSGGITTLCGNLFELDPAVAELEGSCKLVYDRAALIACRPDLRDRYVATLAPLLRPDAGILLITLHYDQSRMSGPPYSVPPDEVARLFSARFEMETLERSDVLEAHPQFAERGLTALEETSWLLKRRALACDG